MMKTADAINREDTGMNHSNTWKGIFLAAFEAIGWGISGVCGQYLFSVYHIESSWITAVRMILSGIVLLTISFSKKKTHIFHIFRDKTDCKWLISFAFLGLLLCQYTYMGAIKYSNSATATVLQSLNVIIMAVVMAVRNHSKMRSSQVVAIILAVLGTYLIATNGNLSEMVLSAPGLVFGLFSAVGVVFYTLLSRPIIQKWSNIMITGWGMLIGGLALGILIQAWNIPTNLDLRAYVIVAVIVLVGTAGGFSAFLQGVKYIGPVKATLIGCIEPVTATIFSAILLNTQFTIYELLGFACIILTVFLSLKE